MSPITKVALVGAGGNLGPAILDKLIEHCFQVTVLSRIGSVHTFPPSIQVHHVDYSSQASLTNALRGQDAVVSALSPRALDHQLIIIDAAVAAGVRRLIPSEFGSDTSNPKCATLPVYHSKIETQNTLKGTPSLTYTVICTGPFLDWGLTRGFMDIQSRRVTLYDGGDRVFSTTTLSTIGRVVCAVLAHPGKTENRVIRVHDIATTQNNLLAIAQKAVGPDDWTVHRCSVDDMHEQSWAAFKQGKRDMQTMLGFIVTAAWGKGYGGHFIQTENEMLGIPEMTEADLQEVVGQLARK
ncbi:NAD(P)-binding protein [Aspergillus sclerotioniger CBS 115572]|uniref:NAD(P)-binding protein n=1 Tax=Aspergillus sclerotioniger CBS 115572 TaxID=1450535 RepID=A0A317VLX1_9EURO|nr:NAD(P)-binding protein [Aspergillus sclerotioniger CBS 115572]PWY75336.1 NAD(P)-binding protein [Aspergillus sclerotioniger CBS 115572]